MLQVVGIVGEALMNLNEFLRNQMHRLCLGLMAFILAVSPLATIAATYYVPSGYASIQAAISSAPDGSEIIVAPGAYVENISALNLKKSLYVRSSGNASNTFISGNNASRILRIDNNLAGDPDKNLVFDGFTFSGGRGDANLSPVSLVNTKVQFLNCRFINNASPAKGGAVLVAATSHYPGHRTHPLFVNCVFENNRSDSYGGAVLVNGGQCQASFKNCLFKNNSNRTAGAYHLVEGGAINYTEAGGVIDSCTFIGNSTYYAGGAIMLLTWWNASSSTLIIRNSRFEGNYCQEGATGIDPPTEGGAIMVENNSNIEISGCTFSNNWAEAGGAVHSFRAGVKIRRSVFEDNVATGAISYGNPTGYGGALGVRFNDAGDVDHPDPTLDIEDTLFRNCSGPSGGAIYFQGDVGYNRQGVFNLSRVTVDRCESTGTSLIDGHSGAIHLHVANMTANQVYLLNNHANRCGGAITLDQGATMTFNNSYIIGNSANLLSNDIYNPFNISYTLNNTIRAFNGNGPTFNSAFLLCLPRVTVNDRVYLTYYVSPDTGNPSISPGLGSLTDLGAYRAGVVDAGPPFHVDLGGGTSTYRLVSSYPDESATVSYAYKGMTNAPFNGQAVRIPARIEAEDFDRGGEVGGYHDTTANNAGGTYRTSEGVDIAPSGSNRVIGWIEQGEWMEYALNVSTTGIYDLTAYVASPSADGRFYVQVDGKIVTGLLAVNNTGGWGAFQPISRTGIFLDAGFHIMRFVAVVGGFNLDGFDWRLSLNDPELSVKPLSHTVVLKQNNTAAVAIQVWNSGASTLSYSITNDAHWLIISPTNGTSTGERNSITAQISAIGLNTGTYSGTIVVASQEATNSPQRVTISLTVVPDRSVRLDFDGDGKSDYGVYRPSAATWYLWQSSKGMTTYQFGSVGDIPVPADYDGDGLCDWGVFRPATVTWYVFRTSLGPMQPFQYGTQGDRPVPADYDGDGVADLAIYRPSTMTWFVFGTTMGPRTFVYGAVGDIPAPADYDGDQRDDFCIFRPSEARWYYFGSTSGASQFVYGANRDLPVPGDYDGDGRLDRAVYRPSNAFWYFRNSSGGSSAFPFGGAGDQPLR